MLYAFNDDEGKVKTTLKLNPNPTSL